VRIRLQDGHVDLESGVVQRGAHQARIGQQGRKIVECLVSAGGALVATDTLSLAVWGMRHVGADARHKAISRLRQELEVEPQCPWHLLSEPGGYRWRPATGQDQPLWVPRPELEWRVRALLLTHAQPCSLVGPLGSGRTGLADTVLGTLADQVDTARIDCRLLDRHEVIKPSYVIEQLRRALAQVLPSLASLVCDDAITLREAVHRSLATSSRPIVLFLDDAERLSHPECPLRVFAALRSYAQRIPGLRLLLTLGVDPSTLIADPRFSAFALAPPLFVGAMQPNEVLALAHAHGVRISASEAATLTADIGALPLDLIAVLREAAVAGWERTMEQLDGPTGLLAHRWQAMDQTLDSPEALEAIAAAASGKVLQGPAYRALVVSGLVVEDRAGTRISTPWLKRNLQGRLG
jgi:hypothetical protein